LKLAEARQLAMAPTTTIKATRKPADQQSIDVVISRYMLSDGAGLACRGCRGDPGVAGRPPEGGCYTRRHQLRRVGRKMPTIGAPELIIVLVIVLILFGPGRLPDIGNAIGKGIREFRKASSEIEESIRGEPKSPDTTPKS
jgi:sec-independent protein translocase protein TatA